MAFRRKAALILELKPDLIIVPECENPNTRRHFSEGFAHQHIWVGDNPHKGLGVFSCRPDLKLHVYPIHDPNIRYAIPIQVRGDTNFNLLAIWAMDDKTVYSQRYIGRVWMALNRYKHLFAEPTLIVGDFNWNVQWDKSRNLCGNLTQVVEVLKEFGITSLYHQYFQEAMGQETRPTLYLHRKIVRPYHIDYIFASAAFTERLETLSVGDYQDWSCVSDHMPLIATFSPVT